EALADLGDAERQLLARRLLDVLEVDVRALRGFGPEVDDVGVFLDRAHEGLEHQVEAPWRAKLRSVLWALQVQSVGDLGVTFVGLCQILGTGQLVESVAVAVLNALDERVAERRDMAARHPDLRVHEDARVEADDVVTFLDHGTPPGVLDVLLELDAEWPVVPHGIDAAIDLGRGKDEA